MTHFQLRDIEDACIKLAARTIARDIVKAVLKDADKELIDKTADRLMRSGELNRPLKAYLDEFAIELKKWIS